MWSFVPFWTLPTGKSGRYIEPEGTQVATRLNNCCIRTGFRQQYSWTGFRSQAIQYSDTTSYGLPRTQDTSRIPNSLVVPVIRLCIHLCIHLCRQIWWAIKRCYFRFSASSSLCSLRTIYFFLSKNTWVLYIYVDIISVWRTNPNLPTPVSLPHETSQLGIRLASQRIHQTRGIYQASLTP